MCGNLFKPSTLFLQYGSGLMQQTPLSGLWCYWYSRGDAYAGWKAMSSASSPYKLLCSPVVVLVSTGMLRDLRWLNRLVVPPSACQQQSIAEPTKSLLIFFLPASVTSINFLNIPTLGTYCLPSFYHHSQLAVRELTLQATWGQSTAHVQIIRIQVLGCDFSASEYLPINPHIWVTWIFVATLLVSLTY